MSDINIEFSLHHNQGIVWNDDSRYRVLVAGRRFGKTTLATNELLKSALNNPKSLNWYVAPTYKQAKMIAWRMLKDLVPEVLITKINESELSVTLINGSVIELRGCDTPDSLRGVGVHFIVVDEFGMVNNGKALWGEVIRPLLTDTKGRALFIGTPKGLNAFYDMYQQGLELKGGFKSFRFETADNPYIDKEEIEAARKELPPRMYDQEYRCSFLTSDDDILIKLEDIEALKGVQYWSDDNKRLVACDPSLGGDECVIYAFEDCKIVGERILFERDSLKIAGELLAMCHKYGADDIAIDYSGGLGEGIAGHLRQQGKKCLVINSGEGADNKERFVNRRAEIWWNVWEKIQRKEVAYPEDIELRRQLTAVQFKVVESNGKIGLVSKQKTKVILGRSPDKADCYVYGLWGLNLIKKKPRNHASKRENRYSPFQDTNSSYGWSNKTILR